MAKKTKHQKRIAKAKRRQAQFKHADELRKEFEAKAKEAIEKVINNKYRACIYQTDTSMPDSMFATLKLSHYELTAEQLFDIKRGIYVDLSECHELDSATKSFNYKVDFDCLYAALNAFTDHPRNWIIGMFLDVNPDKSDEVLLNEMRRGKGGENFVGCINRAKATSEESFYAIQEVSALNGNAIEIDLPKDMLIALRYAA